ncbi:hypothetical protein CI109_101546 [Kwoniella shandongensis]|uniref:Transcription initiation factor TFIID subunit 13 n=1 Tax=Kwoniella shandongensis TaxID=1734106 RepID=A0A5M6C5W8_9TREE|nr:uncharacterized protein CI109_001322 [Kwoniella shandongensis]KAA5530518.1 hypothetical protein CI109_001322 [Kwoniella shandongensis]
MSFNPNNVNQQGIYGQARPNNLPSNVVANGSPNPSTPSPMMGVRPPLSTYNSATAPGTPTPNRPHQFNPAQLAQLTDFHQRQQAALAAQVQRAQAQGIARPNIQAMQLAMQQRMQSQQTQQQQAAFQQILQASSTQSITPQQLQAMAQHVTPQQLQQLQAVKQFMTPQQMQSSSSGITPQQLQAPAQSITPQQLQQLASSSPQIRPSPSLNQQRPISQSALNPALLAATHVATSTVTPPPSNTVRPPVPVTQAFAPTPESIPRQVSPEKTETKPKVTEKRSVSPVKEDKKAKAKDGARRSASPAKKGKEEKKEDVTKAESTDKDKPAAEKPKKPRRPAKPKGDGEKKPRTKKPKEPKEKESGDTTPTVFFTAPETASKDAPTANDNGEPADKSVQSDAEKGSKVAEVKLADSVVKAAPAPPVTVPTSHPVESRRRKEELMRGTMRNEIARLMYGAGDVAEPDVDTVDYMEDMVVEFLADLCRPSPPIRPTPTSQRQPIPMSFDVLRHRLSSSPAMGKYLERFDRMVYMSEALKSAKNIANPTPHELIASVGADFLELDDDGKPTAGGGGGGGQRTKRSAGQDGGDEAHRKKARPLKLPGEKRKPGPQKGWKLNRETNGLQSRRPVIRDPNAPKRKYVRKVGAGAGAGGGAKKEM